MMNFSQAYNRKSVKKRAATAALFRINARMAQRQAVLADLL